MSVTLKQIANELNISQATVTNALNGKPNVGEAMRLKIQETALLMGYDRNANRDAQNLIAKRHGRRVEHGVIALIYKLTDDAAWQYIPFYRSLVDGVEFELDKRGIDLYTIRQRDTLPRIVSERKVDGLIALSGTGRIRDEMHALALPVVTLGSWGRDTFSILPDGTSGMYQATKHLLELGHTRIAYLGKDHSRVEQKRLAGYVQALTEHNIPVDKGLLPWFYDCIPDLLTVPSAQHGYIIMDALLDKYPLGQSGRPDFTAMVCQNDVLAMGAVRRALEAGLHVPQDLSVVGFDDVTAQYNFHPPLTSVAYPGFEMGQRAVEWLYQEVKSYLESGTAHNEWRPSEGEETFPTHLSHRGSTQVPWQQTAGNAARKIASSPKAIGKTKACKTEARPTTSQKVAAQKVVVPKTTAKAPPKRQRVA